MAAATTLILSTYLPGVSVISPNFSWTAHTKEVQKRHSLPPRSFHSLRHYFLSAMVRGGANLEAVRELAGSPGPQKAKTRLRVPGFQSVSLSLSSGRADSTAAITEGACSCAIHMKTAAAQLIFRIRY